jgi:hypothetical protein
MRDCRASREIIVICKSSRAAPVARTMCNVGRKLAGALNQRGVPQHSDAALTVDLFWKQVWEQECDTLPPVNDYWHRPGPQK